MHKSKITTITGLVDTLNQGPDNYLDVMKRATIPIRDFEHYYRWNEDHCTRNCISRTDDYELVLVCWEKGQQSPIHDYDLGQAWIHPIAGRLLEERFRIMPDKKIERVSAVILGTTEFSYMDEIAIHRFQNIYGARSASLHLYTEPINKWRVYDELTGAYDLQEVAYDSTEALT